MTSIVRFLALLACLQLFNMPAAFAEKLCSNYSDRDYCFQQLATAIEHSFPNLDPNDLSTPTPATAGTDWCFEYESDPTTNWWYFHHSDGIRAHSSDGGLRIKAVYRLPSGVIGFASIFLAVDLLKISNYAQTGGTSSMVAPTIGNGSPVALPPNPDNSKPGCPTDIDFIKSALPKYLGKWELVDDPLCNGTECGTTTVGGHKVKNVEASITDVNYPLYWRFNSETHTIAGALRFMIKFTEEPYQNAVLWVGYGGSGAGG